MLPWQTAVLWPSGTPADRPWLGFSPRERLRRTLAAARLEVVPGTGLRIWRGSST